ncbi:helix-turn-helix transcriptional regulator [Marinobacter xestospongiae]|uniref:AraC family transcriptional regulator n=1 Tax=Marinobacter xestospongiae TaxID=994319 RepID=A0ABU3VXK0_9GAMM|nr:AraC family transcriptional regulator [Marinobacter xestospongiae]MDV2079003.1 AraC family transcriptional regulator [Marinobacter xestospongiae]
MLNARLLKLPEAAHQHRHDYHQLVIGVRGEAELSVDGNGSRLDNWRACLVPTEARHDYRGDHQNHVLVINLDPYIPSLNSPRHADYDQLAPMFERPRTVSLDTRLQGMVQFCATEFDRSPDNEALRRHLSASILHCLAERVALSEPRRAVNRVGLSPETIRRYVMENLHKKVTVKDMANVACLSVSRFHEIFRELTGVSPHQFLIQTRLDQAVQLLTGTQLSVTEISYRTGFSSQSALTNALRKHRGTIPSKLRNSENVRGQ